MAKKMLKIPVVKWIAEKLKVIPLQRPQDVASTGDGTITLKSPTEIEGVGTNFTKQCEVGDAIMGDDGPKFQITKIISDTEIEMKFHGESADLYDTIQDIPYKIHPKIDQSEVFSNVFEGLRDGKSIGIFPEGGSHD